MNRLPDDPAARRLLWTGLLAASALMLACALFDLPWLATGVLPGVWVALASGPRRCRRRGRDAPAPG